MSTEAKWAQVSQGLGNVTDETRAIARAVCEAAWEAQVDIWWVWGDGDNPDHNKNRSGKPVLDFMVHSQEDGDWVRNHLWENRALYGLRHVIWWQRITSTVVQPGVVRVMEDRGNSTKNHRDHNHFEGFGGVYKGGAPAPSKPAVEVPKFIAVDGQLGPQTISKWQSVMGTPVDGVISRDSLLIRAVQRRLKQTVDGTLAIDGDMGKHTIRSLQRYLKSPVDGVISKPRSKVIVALQRRLNENRF